MCLVSSNPEAVQLLVARPGESIAFTLNVVGGVTMPIEWTIPPERPAWLDDHRGAQMIRLVGVVPDDAAPMELELTFTARDATGEVRTINVGIEVADDG